MPRFFAGERLSRLTSSATDGVALLRGQGGASLDGGIEVCIMTFTSGGVGGGALLPAAKGTRL